MRSWHGLFSFDRRKHCELSAVLYQRRQLSRGRRCDLNVNFGSDTHSFCGDITVGCDPFLDNKVKAVPVVVLVPQASWWGWCRRRGGAAGGAGGAGAEGGAGELVGLVQKAELAELVPQAGLVVLVQKAGLVVLVQKAGLVAQMHLSPNKRENPCGVAEACYIDRGPANVWQLVQRHRERRAKEQ